MMHVRRRFYHAFKLFKLGDKRATLANDFIRKLYEVDAEGRLAVRKQQSLSVLAAPLKWIVEIEPSLGKTSKLAQAVCYAINQRVYVERCFGDGRFEFDNGEIERGLKKP